MNDIDVKLIVGSLLHDIGKLIHRQGIDKRKHNEIAYSYLKENIENIDEDILSCVRFHHSGDIEYADIPDNDLAYIVYMADNIASATDRREKTEAEIGFDINTPLQPVFNILHKNEGKMYYSPPRFNIEDEINYPKNEKEIIDEHCYSKIIDNITSKIKEIKKFNEEDINSLLEILEANLSYIPSSTSKNELHDISLYDHLKLTSAISSCIKEYLDDTNIKDYKSKLHTNGYSFYNDETFLMASMDVSGIQHFIYTITSKKALKTLRARSFYLEIMMEHIIDLILQRLNLSRANLIYSGGGHCYLLMANTNRSKEVFDDFIKEINHWFLNKFQTNLYIAGAYSDCSGNSLKNSPKGSYSDIFKRLSTSLSKKKMNRYSADEIISLNKLKFERYDRECTVCKSVSKVNNDGICPFCLAIERFSTNILNFNFFTILEGEKDEELSLPGGYSLVADGEKTLSDRIKDKDFVRVYVKNKMYLGKYPSTKLWVGDYSDGKTFEEYARDNSKTIDRIGVLRADVDNLGHAFVSGFDNEANDNKYVTLSRTASLSKQLSLFFKLYINKILRESEFSLLNEDTRKRKATIVYSGGDDLFIVGTWNDVIELSIDIRKAFDLYTQGTLTISAGIGIYDEKYPISVIANEVEKLEDKSKSLPEDKEKGFKGKSAITLLEDGEEHEVILADGTKRNVSDGTYHWDEFEKEVILEKFKIINDFFKTSEDKGNSFLYNLLDLIRNQKTKIFFARYVYLISRMEPKGNGSKHDTYEKFSKKMLQWIRNERDQRQLKTAIILYAYLHRERKE